MGVWRRRGEVASARLSAAPYSVHHKLYSEAVVASAAALAEVGRFKEAVEYVQKAAKALYEAARDVFGQVKVSPQRLAELFVEAVARALARVDKHKAYLFLMAAVSAGAVALSAALNPWGLIELDKLAYAAALTPFVPAGVKEYSREGVFNILKNAPDPYEKFKKMARNANAGKAELPQPWESLRVLILPKRSEEKRLMVGGGAELYSKYRGDENYKRALFYAVLALEEAFGFYRSALRKYMVGLREAVQREEVGEEPFKRVVYMPDLGLLTQLAEEEGKAFENALRILRERLNEYAVKYGLRDLLDVDEDMARRLAEAEVPEFSEFNGVNFGVKILAALIAYREYALGRRGAYGIAAWHWLELGGSAWLLYYAPRTAYDSAKRTKVERPVAVEELVAESLCRLFLKPGADHYSRFVEELTKGGRLALMPEGENESSYVFRLFRLEEGGGRKELGIRLKIEKVGESIVYALEFDDAERWLGFFKQKLDAAEKAAEEVKGHLLVEDRFPYMVGWVNSDVAISGGRLEMSTSHLWQLAETHALFGWSDIVVFRVNLTLEGPKPQFLARTSLEKLDEAIRRSAGGGWLNMLGAKAGLEDLMHVKSWDDLKRWVADHWGIVVDAAVKRLGEEIRGELKAVRNKLNDDKVAREVVAPALLLIQAEKLGVDETTLRYFGAVVSGAVGGDGYVSSAEGKVVLTSGKHAVALLWGATLAAYSIEAKVRGTGSAIRVITSGGDAARLAGLYFLYGPPLLEGDDRLKSHKLAGAMELSAKEALNIRWEGLRLTKSGVAADLIISEGDASVKYNIYLRNKIGLYLESADRSRVELAARLLQRAGITTKVQKECGRDEWYVMVHTDMLAAGREELRKALAEIVEAAVKNGLMNASKAEGWLKKLEKGRVLKEGWPKYYVGLTEGALEVKFSSTKPHKIEREAQRLREMGLVEGVHFTMKMPEDGGAGYLYILRKGLEYVAWLSVYGEGERQRLAAEFVKYILRRAWEEGEEVYEKAKEIIEKGKAMGSLTLKGFEKRVEVGGREHVVKVIDGSAELKERQDGKTLLRIKITAEVDGVRREYAITYGRYQRNAAVGFATAKADAPGGREADAERLAAVIKALTGEEPKIRRMKDGTIIIKCYGRHLEGFERYAELADVIAKWLK